MYKIILSFRYLFKKRISYLAFLAVALCVFIVVVVMTVIAGLVRDFKDSNHKWVGDCVVGTESLVGFPYYEDFIKKIEAADFIEGVSAVVKSYALIKNRDLEWNSGVEILGIDPVKHSKVTNFGETLYHRKNDSAKAFEPVYDPNLTGCVVGIDRWLTRDDNGKYGYEVSPVEAALLVSCFPLTAKGALAKAGTDLVNTKTFYYSDTSHSGLVWVDSSYVYLPFEDAQLLCGMGGAVKRVIAIHIKFKQNVKLTDGCDKVAALWKGFVEEKKGETQAELLDTVTVQSWKDYRREFIAAMEKEQTILTFMFALVGVTTVFIVFVVFYMIVSHKSKDIGILKSIGVSRLDIVELFSCFAFLIGLLGSAAGAFGGWLFLLKINRIEDFLFAHFGFQLWDRAMYAIGDIPATIDLKVLAVIIVSAIGACLAGAFFPSRQAARLEPVETLQVSQL
ncbi:MAG: FtsX-like permease family protein [Phycisphaerae bacterium]|jgi:lipoprotein-releasing system permease protein